MDMNKNVNFRGILLSIVLVFFMISPVLADDTGWQNLRTNGNYVVCGGNYPACTNSILGVDWFNMNNGDRGYGLICGEVTERGNVDCSLWGNSGIGRIVNIPNAGEYYLMLKIWYSYHSAGDDELLITGITNSWPTIDNPGSYKVVSDLGSGDKACVVRDKFQVNSLNNKFWIGGIGGSVNPYQARLKDCISPTEVNEGLVYCDNGLPVVADCPVECVPSLVNSSWSSWVNVGCSDSRMSQSRFRVQYDSNNCGTVTNRTFYEYRLVGPTWQNTSWSSWVNVGCSGYDMQQRRYLTQYDTYGCASSTIFYSYRTLSSNIINTSWSSWINLGCLNSTHRRQSRFIVEYDANKLGCFSNRTYYEYRAIADSSCYSCIPDIQYTTWSSWTNLACVNSTHRQQSRFRVQYDSNNCGTFANITTYEYRLIADSSCDSGVNNLFIDIISPISTTYTNNTILVNLSSNGTSVWYSWNGTNASYNSPHYVNFNNGVNTLHAWANNSLGEIVYENVTFLINIGNGSGIGIDVHSPVDGRTYYVSSVLLNATSNISANIWAYSLNNGSAIMNSTPSSSLTTLLTGLTTGSYSLLVCGLIDNFNGDCKTVNFRVDLDDDDDDDDEGECKTCLKPFTTGNKSIFLISNNTEEVISLSKKKNSEENLSFRWLSWLFIILMLIAIAVIIFLIIRV